MKLYCGFVKAVFVVLVHISYMIYTSLVFYNEKLWINSSINVMRWHKKIQDFGHTKMTKILVKYLMHGKTVIYAISVIWLDNRIRMKLLILGR